MEQELNVNIISCDHIEGLSKTTQKPYSFFTGQVYLLGGVVKYISSTEFKADITKNVRTKVKLSPDKSGNLQVTLEALTIK